MGARTAAEHVSNARSLSRLEGNLRAKLTRRLDELRLDAFTARNEQHREAIARVDSGREVIRKVTVRDPLFGSVDDEVLAIGRLGGRAAKTGDVGSGKGFRNGEGNELATGEDFGNNFLLELVRTVVHDGRQAVDPCRQSVAPWLFEGSHSARSRLTQ